MHHAQHMRIRNVTGEPENEIFEFLDVSVGITGNSESQRCLSK